MVDSSVFSTDQYHHWRLSDCNTELRNNRINFHATQNPAGRTESRKFVSISRRDLFWVERRSFQIQLFEDSPIGHLEIARQKHNRNLHNSSYRHESILRTAQSSPEYSLKGHFSVDDCLAIFKSTTTNNKKKKQKKKMKKEKLLKITIGILLQAIWSHSNSKERSNRESRLLSAFGRRNRDWRPIPLSRIAAIPAISTNFPRENF
jgi:hypothetical protein